MNYAEVNIVRHSIEQYSISFYFFQSKLILMILFRKFSNVISHRCALECF